MNTFLNFQQEFVNVNNRKDLDRQLTRVKINPLNIRINQRGVKEQFRALLGIDSRGKLAKGTRASGCRVFTKYDFALTY